MVNFPYYSHIFGDSYGSGMGIVLVWEAYHKGVPLLGVPENPIDSTGHPMRRTSIGFQQKSHRPTAPLTEFYTPINGLTHSIHGTAIFTYMNG